MKLLFIASFLAISLFFHASAVKQGKTCLFDHNCDGGLHCENCIVTGNVRTRCTRKQPVIPTSKVLGLPFNRYSWLTAHNAFAKTGSFSKSSSTTIITPECQQDSVTDQLKNGVRGFMLDMYDYEDDIWLCHSFGEKCYEYTAFQPAVNVLKEIKSFLESNPSEIVTIIIEDYVTSPNGLTKIFDAAGLRPFWFPVSRMPKDGGDWPIIDDMIKQNQRLLVFTSKPDKEASEGIAFQWSYMVENQYGDGGMQAGLCPNRAESLPVNAKTRSLLLVNYFPDTPSIAAACKYNSGPLAEIVNTCRVVAGDRWPNYIAVDFYMKSEGGGAPAAVDFANGELICGCQSIDDCKANSTKGDCGPPPAAIIKIGNNTNSGAVESCRPRPAKLMWLLGVLSLANTLF